MRFFAKNEGQKTKKHQKSQTNKCANIKKEQKMFQNANDYIKVGAIFIKIWIIWVFIALLSGCL